MIKFIRGLSNDIINCVKTNWFEILLFVFVLIFVLMTIVWWYIAIPLVLGVMSCCYGIGLIERESVNSSYELKYKKYPYICKFGSVLLCCLYFVMLCCMGLVMIFVAISKAFFEFFQNIPI